MTKVSILHYITIVRLYLMSKNTIPGGQRRYVTHQVESSLYGSRRLHRISLEFSRIHSLGVQES